MITGRQLLFSWRECDRKNKKAHWGSNVAGPNAFSLHEMRGVSR
jgi:DNA-binding ferritin-like protein